MLYYEKTMKLMKPHPCLPSGYFFDQRILQIRIRENQRISGRSCKAKRIFPAAKI
jgi:hypothetical protein